MPTITWKGEDELHGENAAGPSFTIWNGKKFPKGEAVEISDALMIKKARANPFFEVDGEDSIEPSAPRRGRPPKNPVD